MTFHLTFVHIILVRFGLLSGHLLLKSCSVAFCILTIWNLSYFPFDFEGVIWVLIVPVPDHCILVNFVIFQHSIVL